MTSESQAALRTPPTALTAEEKGLTSSFGLDSIPTKNAGAPAFSITSGSVLLDAMAMLRANLANVKSIEESWGSLDALVRNLDSCFK